MAGKNEIGSIYVNISADTLQFLNKLHQAEKESQKFGSRVTKWMGGVTSAIAAPARALFSLKGAILAAGAAIGAGKLAHGMHQTAEEVDRIGKAAKRLGVDVGGLSALRFAAAEANVEFESLAKLMGKAGKNVATLAADGKAVVQVGALSVRLKDASGHVRSITDLLPDLARGIESAGSEAEQLQLSEKFFGREGGGAFLDLLHESGDFMANLATQTERARRLGVLLTPEQVSTLTEYADAVDRIGHAWFGVKVKIMTELAPALTKIANQTASFVASVPEMVANVMRAFGEGPDAAVVMDRLKTFGIALGRLIYTAVVDGGSAALETLGSRASARIQIMVEDATSLFKKNTKDINTRMAEILAKSDPEYGQRFDSWVAKLGKDAQFAAKTFDELTGASGILARRSMEIATATAGGVDKAKESITDLGRRIADFATDAENAIKGWAGSFSDATADLVFESKANFAELARSWAKTLLSMAMQKLAFQPIFEAAGSFFGGLFGSAPTPTQPPSGYTYSGIGPDTQAQGGVKFAAGGTKGGVTKRPYQFPLETGIIGEIGKPEGYFPLAYINGELGVRGVTPAMNVQIVDQRGSGARPEVSQTRGPDGRQQLRILIRDEMKAAFTDGAMDRVMGAGYGLSRRGTAR